MTNRNPLSKILGSTIILLTILCLSLPAFSQQSRPVDKGQDVSILSDSATLTKGDYLVHLQKVFETINKVPVTVGSFRKLKAITTYLTRDEAALALLKSRLSQSDRLPNLQNLQMAQTLLEELHGANKECLVDLDEYEKELRSLKTEILMLRKDTVLIKLFTHPAVRAMFKEQFVELRKKGQVTDSLIKATTIAINDLLT
jgi:potassium efflux system protein